LKNKFRKIVALTLVAMLFCPSASTVFSVAHEFEEAGITTPHSISVGFLHMETDGHCPSCPTEDHPSTDHDHFSCDHHTYLSLTAHNAYRHPVPVMVSLLRLETSRFVPEVYPSIDTPPHIPT
jgi:hypothetical protein